MLFWWLFHELVSLAMFGSLQLWDYELFYFSLEVLSVEFVFFLIVFISAVLLFFRAWVSSDFIDTKLVVIDIGISLWDKLEPCNVLQECAYYSWIKFWRAIKLEELLFLFVEDNHEYVKITQYAQLYSLFKQRPLPLWVGGHSLLVVWDIS